MRITDRAQRPVRSKNFLSQRQEGFNLVEIVIATGIISLSLVSVIYIAGQSLVISHTSLDTYVASTVLEEAAEAVRVVRDDSWADIAALDPATTYYPTFDSSTNTWLLSTSSSDGVVGMYTRSITVEEVLREAGSGEISPSGSPDADAKRITAHVTWTTSDGRDISRSLSFYLMNIFI
jgi:Tfp pilus assembly protein PilV